MKYENKTVLIVEPAIKNKILLEINAQKEILDIKVYTINEFIKKYYFDYDEKALYYITKKYQVKPEIAQIYVDNLYYLNDSIFDNPKLNFLIELKKDLINNKLLTTNRMFLEWLKNYQIIFYNIKPSKYNLSFFKELSNCYNTKIFNSQLNEYNHQVYHIDTLENEVIFVSNKISNLINKGINPNNIYLANLSDEARIHITKYFSLFKIPVELKNDTAIYGTNIVKKFLKNYQSDNTKSLESIKDLIINEDSNDIYEKIVMVINKYSFVNDYDEVKELIIWELKKTKIREKKNALSIKEVNYLEETFTNDDYVFLFNVNQGNVPKIYKDENYLEDSIMKQLGLDTASDKNKLENLRTIVKIKNIKNLCLMFIDYTYEGKLYKSSIIDELGFEVISPKEQNFTYSHSFNKLTLASYMEDYQKYNIINDSLILLHSNYKLEKYDNSFKGIDTTNFHNYINKHLVLSYTSLDSYYKCAFRYYLTNILKINIYEETFMQVVGNIFHYVLENIFKNEKSFEELFLEAKNKEQYEYSIKDKFFLRKLKKELLFIVETINEQNSYSNLTNELYEEKIITNIEGNIKIEFKCLIDKIKFKEENGKTILVIIDYKTGTPSLNLNNIIYGLSLQLPLYIYLTKNNPKFSNVEIAGFYLQKILNNEVISEPNKTYLELKKDALKLQGYSNESFEIIKDFDNTFMDSKVIKSLKVSSKGFYSYSKVLSNKKMEQLESIALSKINEGAKNIEKGNFAINPKKIKNILIGCEFCKYKDICFKEEKDIIVLKEYKDLEFLEGDES